MEVGFILSPTLWDARMKAEVPGEPALRFFDFNDPRRYPELYLYNVRHDSVHLTYDAAVVFSGELAREVLPMLEGKGR